MWRGSHGLSARRARRTKSRGPKGLQLEVGARRAPKLLVYTYCCSLLQKETSFLHEILWTLCCTCGTSRFTKINDKWFLCKILFKTQRDAITKKVISDKNVVPTNILVTPQLLYVPTKTKKQNQPSPINFGVRIYIIAVWCEDDHRLQTFVCITFALTFVYHIHMHCFRRICVLFPKRTNTINITIGGKKWVTLIYSKMGPVEPEIVVHCCTPSLCW